MSTQTRAVSKRSIETFRKTVWAHYRAHGRHDLPWRKTTSAYHIMVSEIMLQQTQVHRVREKYKSFLKEFPTVRDLAAAPLSAVMREWSGLGYNRRGKYLHDAAKEIVDTHGGSLKRGTEGNLPGIGPYTKAAIRTFAYNEPHMMIETNIRAAFIHHFFNSGLTKSRIKSRITAVEKKISDKDLVPLIELCSEGQDPRAWYWALMDYGAYVKRLHVNPTRRSASYVMQSKFIGSLREIRGAVIKVLGTGAHGDLALAHKLSFEEHRIREALTALKKDGLVVSNKGSWRIA